jgi:hypothetical protein
LVRGEIGWGLMGLRKWTKLVITDKAIEDGGGDSRVSKR